MAGPHQIWTLDLANNTVSVWAGSGDREHRLTARRASAAFAQPSGLATDGTYLYVADSEVSGVRAVRLDGNRVETVVGVDLFGFGDVDGVGDRVRLQHCLGLAYSDGTLYIADTYNNKIKVCKPTARAVQTFLGSRQPGLTDDPAPVRRAWWPEHRQAAPCTSPTPTTTPSVPWTSTNQKVRTLTLEGVDQTHACSAMPQASRTPRSSKLDPTEVAPGEFRQSERGPVASRGVQGQPRCSDALSAGDSRSAWGAWRISVAPTGDTVDPPASSFTVKVPLASASKAGDTLTVKLSVSAFLCEADALRDPQSTSGTSRCNSPMVVT